MVDTESALVGVAAQEPEVRVTVNMETDISYLDPTPYLLARMWCGCGSELGVRHLRAGWYCGYRGEQSGDWVTEEGSGPTQL